MAHGNNCQATLFPPCAKVISSIRGIFKQNPAAVDNFFFFEISLLEAIKPVCQNFHLIWDLEAEAAFFLCQPIVGGQ